MTIFWADSFAANRDGAVAAPYNWNVTNIFVIPCPSGFGWALSRDPALTANAQIDVRTPGTLPTLTNRSVGQSAIYTLQRNPAIATWFTILSSRRVSTFEVNHLQWQMSTNLWRVARDNGPTQLGVPFAGPADVSQPFEIAMEFFRDVTQGSFRVWFNGVLAYEIFNVNSGIYNGGLGLNQSLSLPGGQGGVAPQTASNWLGWIPTLRPYPGKRIVTFLPPVADFQRQWIAPAGPHYAALADSGLLSSLVTGQPNLTNIYDMQNLLVEPQIIEALWLHFNQVSAPLNFQLIEAAGMQVITQPTSGRYNFQLPLAFGGEPWSFSKINALRVGTAVPGDGGGNRSLVHMHLASVQSPEILQQAARTRSQIITTRSWKL